MGWRPLVRHPEGVLRRTARGYEPPAPVEDEEEPAPRRRRIGGRTLTVVLLIPALAFLAVAVMRVLGIDGDVVTIVAIALTPYIAAAGAVLCMFAFALLRRLIALAVLLLALSLGVLLLPRIQANGQPDVHGVHIRILAANLNDGHVDPAIIKKLVLDNKIDLAVLPELSRAETPSLDEPDFFDALPFRVLDPGVVGSGDGSGIYSRFPLRQTALVDALELSMPSAIVDLPGRDDIEITAAHVQSALHSADVWKRDLGRLPPTQKERVRVIAGDFNATWDHAAFRSVLDRGYADAAEQTGDGLNATWAGWGPPLTIDHVLFDRRCAVREYKVLQLPGSDHNAILADLQLP
jgi:endonuclease/exonuclease/phosphatase (EEP) superfamily protein YafD